MRRFVGDECCEIEYVFMELMGILLGNCFLPVGISLGFHWDFIGIFFQFRATIS